MKDKPVAEELALRIRPVRQPWPGGKTVLAGAFVVGAVLAGLAYTLLRDIGTFRRRELRFPPPPRLDTAITAAQEKLKAYPQDLSALVELGTLHFEKGKDFYPDAINELEEARDLGALDARIFYCLGVMYQEEGLYPFALEEYRRYLRHYPDDKETRLLEAKLLYRQGNFAEAVSEYERLRFLFPKDALIEENLGLSLMGAKLGDRAAESFGRLKAFGGDAAARADFYLGQLAFDGKRYDEAVKHWLACRAVEGSPAFGIAASQVEGGLGAAFQKLGRLDEAKAAWDKVLEETPGDAKAKTALREIARRLPVKRKPRARKR